MKNSREKKAFAGIYCKVFVIMTLCLCMVTNLWANSSSASPQRVTINLKNAAVKQVFAEIRKQTTYNFVYSDDQMDKLKPVTLNVTAETVENVLNKVLEGTPYTYTIEGNSIAIVARDNVKKEVKEIRVTGNVKDKDGLPLPGVSVIVKGTTVGVATDIDGNYTLTFAERQDVTLVFSFVGMQSKEVPYTGQKEINVVLEEEQVSLGDVVVIGYGTKSKHDVTSSVSSINADRLSKFSSSATSFDGMLGGALKGVLVTQNNGAPGAPSKINVRGITSPVSGSSNEPLYVIDDVPFFSQQGGMSPLLVISPNDIESIDVLKDAAATAIYGSRGANGVIIVKTKSGRRNEKLTVTAGYSVTVANPVKRYKPLNTAQFAEVQDMMMKYSAEAMNAQKSAQIGGGYRIDEGTRGMMLGNMLTMGDLDVVYDVDYYTPLSTTYNGLLEGVIGDVNTNWVKEIENSNATNQQFNLGISGGSQNINYSFSFNSVNQDGIYINDGFKRYGGRLAVDANVTDRLRSGVTMGYSLSKRKDATGTADEFYKVWNIRPDAPVKKENGDWGQIDLSPSWGMPVYGANPVAKRQISNRSEMYQFIGSAYAEYRIIDGLKVRGDINIANFQSKGSSFTPAFTQEDWSAIGGSTYPSTRDVTSSDVSNTSINFRADYSLDIEDHRLSFMVGYGWDRTFSTSEYAGYQDFADDEVLNNIGSAASAVYYGDGKSVNGLNSVYARIGYIYSDRYLAEVNFRSDASSKFGPGNKRGYFPSLSLGWRMSNERFMEDFSKLDDLKLRFSVGQTGSTNIDDFVYKQLFGRASNDLWAQKPSVLPKGAFPNRDVRWEMTTEYNGGVDFSFFNRRLYGSVDAYYRFTDGALSLSPVALETGSITYYSNLLDLTNKGLEVEVSGDIIRNDDWNWTSSFNIAFNRNKVKDLHGATLSSSQVDQVVVGYPAGVMKGYVVDGIFQSNEEVDRYNYEARLANGVDPTDNSIYFQESGTSAGDYKYRDLDGDGRITSDDRKVIANPEPKFFGGFFNSVTYKNWNLAVVFQFSQGAEAMLNDLSTSAYGNLGYSIPREFYHNTWTPENTNARYAQLLVLDPGKNYRTSDRYVFKTSYLRLKNITLSYNLPNLWAKRVGLESAQLFVSTSNLWTWSNWPGLDPELMGDDVTVGRNPITQAVFSNDNYPLSKTFTFGFKVSF
ncbi:TonB-dependent receptor [uncultured Butyricimonas sp.]|uniref:TonB-dependent receptor n=1 Tax=uncultured Butyricimonas sp. TaxID=1268785 RepID=UPI0026DBBA36|nr:TonB-dependent receptor [uncultured Butyricimonas sp.]